VDFLREKRVNAKKSVKAKFLFKDAVDLLDQRVQLNSTMKQSRKGYRLLCIQKIKSSWPELWGHALDEITIEQCSDWAANLQSQIAKQYFNNVAGALRLIFGKELSRKFKPAVTKSKIPPRNFPNPRFPKKFCNCRNAINSTFWFRIYRHRQAAAP
jgi:hypothetical protein